MEYTATKTLGSLRPDWPTDQETFKNAPEGTRFRVKSYTPRNLKFLQRHMVLLNMVYQSLPESFTEPSDITIDGKVHKVAQIPNFEAFRDEIKIKLGYVEHRFTSDGEIHRKPKSISFASMNEEDFQAFHSQTIDIILRDFLPQNNREEIEQAVIHFV